MLHSKTFMDIDHALHFANNNSIIPVSFMELGIGRIMLVYEAVEIPEPGNHEIDLLKEAESALTQYFYNCSKIDSNKTRDLLLKINKCLSSQ